jgi:FtsH-binding integral membrane protein
MSESLTYQEAGAAARDQTQALFAQTMGYVAATAGLFALGAYLGRHLAGGAGIIAFIAAFACLIGMQFAVRRSRQLTVGLLGAFGLAFARVPAAYASMDPRAPWQAGGATALFIAAFGAADYATRLDLTVIVRGQFLGAAGPDRVRHRAYLRQHPRRHADLLRARSGHLRWLRHG